MHGYAVPWRLHHGQHAQVVPQFERPGLDGLS